MIKKQSRISRNNSFDSTQVTRKAIYNKQTSLPIRQSQRKFYYFNPWIVPADFRYGISERYNTKTKGFKFPISLPTDQACLMFQYNQLMQEYSDIHKVTYKMIHNQRLNKIAGRRDLLIKHLFTLYKSKLISRHQLWTYAHMLDLIHS